KTATKKTRKFAAPKKATAKAAKPKATATKKTGDKKLSALDAAAKVLGESKEPLNAKQMIEKMAAKKYWTSPGGKTPHATLYAAILREINVKGKDARFKKTDRGHFVLATTVKK
ncbi:MAG TPA: HTH domain-containing protein, partial [Planctomycetaceae bacterium]|nr:HTH domain-containing protein [Planctomycetaceae bacterium]